MTGRDAAHDKVSREGEMMERDPVCGMTVDPARAAAQMVYAGKTYYFCCARCGDKFRAAPAEYLNANAPAVMQRNNAPVHFSRAGAPAAAPALAILHENMHGTERSAEKSAAANAYVCPMDPGVREDYPGACPK